jgi:long-chain acyl-CoA synthetase
LEKLSVITDGLRRQAAIRPDAVFLSSPGSTTTFAEMVVLVDSAASRLGGVIVPDSRVAILCGNRPAFLVAWFAVNELGATAVLLNTNFVGEGLRFSIQQSGSSVLLVEDELLKSRSSTLASLFAPERMVVLDERFEQPMHLAQSTPHVVRGAEAASSILFTSGTTGHPKGAVISHGSYECAGDDMVRASGMTADDRLLVFLPLFHANPQMYAVLPALECGAELILLPRFSASSFFDQARKFGATAFTYVGTVLSILVSRHAGPVRDHAIQWCVGGGAPEEVWADVEDRFGIAVRELYGMTETGGWVSMNTPKASRRGSVGRARDQVELSIRDDGRVLPARASGEIVARSLRPNAFFTEYWADPEATSETIQDGWLHTGDRGFIDDDGYLHFQGRIKDLIRRGGEMISPVEIEDALSGHPAVSECAAAGVFDEMLGEEIIIAVVLRSPATPDELRSFLRGRVAQHLIPRYIAIVETLPRTETTKVKRYEIARLLHESSEGALNDAKIESKRV